MAAGGRTMIKARVVGEAMQYPSREFANFDGEAHLIAGSFRPSDGTVRGRPNHRDATTRPFRVVMAEFDSYDGMAAVGLPSGVATVRSSR